MRTDKLSYNDVAIWFTRCRNPDNGRPVMSWARMFKVGENYELRFGKDVVGVFTPDNKFTFTLNSQQARNCSITLSQALQRAIPFLWTRKGTGRYTIKPTPSYEEYKKDNPNAYSWDYFRTAPEYEVFDGLQFDLNTYEPTNARPPIGDTINPEKRTEWLRALRKFKRSVQVRAKLGVVDTLIKEVYAERQGAKSRHDWEMPDWNTPTWQDVLYQSLSSGELTTDLLKGIVKSVSTGYYQTSITVPDVLKTCDQICTTYSVELRRRFGVFEEGETNEVSEVQHSDDVLRHTMEHRPSANTQAMVV